MLAVRLDPPAPAISGQARASDGDSLHLAGERVRLLGIDAPELAQTCQNARGRSWACGSQARAALAALLGRGTLACQPDGRDRFGRILARCTVGGDDLGEVLVRQGWALATDGYGSAEAEARRAGRGIWQGPFEVPRDWRRARDDASDDAPGGGLLDGLLRLLGS